MSSVLLVDDEPGIRAVMRRWAESLGYVVREAATAEEALAAMAEDAAGLVICDISMPGHDGLWLVERLRAAHPDTAVVMATGATDIDAALFSLHQGVVDYLVKPFSREHLRESLRRGIEAHRQAVRSRQRLTELDKQLRERVAELTRRIAETGVTSEVELEDLLVSLTGDDRPAYEHGQRVASLATNIALTLHVREPELGAIRHAARLHDLGRLATPEDILSKRATLSIEEREIVKRRPALVADALRRCPFLADAADIVRSVHERFDGQGYPWGLQGGEIPLGARIIAVADTFDTMTHPRVHREARPLSEALFEVQRCRDSQFDPDVVGALLKVVGLHWNRNGQRGAGDVGDANADANTPEEGPSGPALIG
ncbi:MAG: HD domain-containing phosphohydrolase [Acidobacteriota bacterium]